MTIAELLLPSVGLHRLATSVAERHYASGLHGPGAKEMVLARIREAAGDLEHAEDYLRQAAAKRPDEYEMFLGQFFARTGNRGAAIAAFERARHVTHRASDLTFIETRLRELQESDGTGRT